MRVTVRNRTLNPSVRRARRADRQEKGERMRRESGQRLLLDAREELQLETVDRAEDQSELASTAIPALITASQALQSLAGVLLGERDTSAAREIRRRLNALEWNT